MKLTIRPLTAERWNDVETIFNAKGCSVARGCWCMFYRRSGSSDEPAQGVRRAKPRARHSREANRAALRALVDAGEPPGLIGYRGKTPVGWVSLGPREAYTKLRRSPVLKAVDEQPVWSIICFVVPAQYRGEGVARALLDGAIVYAKKRGGTLLEAYPVDHSERARDDAM